MTHTCVSRRVVYIYVFWYIHIHLGTYFWCIYMYFSYAWVEFLYIYVFFVGFLRFETSLESNSLCVGLLLKNLHPSLPSTHSVCPLSFSPTLSLSLSLAWVGNRMRLQEFFCFLENSRIYVCTYIDSRGEKKMSRKHMYMYIYDSFHWNGYTTKIRPTIYYIWYLFWTDKIRPTTQLSWYLAIQIQIEILV